MTCLIAGENYEEQMAPFQENNMDDCPQEYLDTYYYDTETEHIVFNSEEQAKAHCEKNGIEFNPEMGHWDNSNACWDWYQVGGRWHNFFVKKQDGYGGKGEPCWMDMSPDTDENKVDIVRKGDIDIEKTMALRAGCESFLEAIQPYSFINNGEFIARDTHADYDKLFEDWWNSLSDDTVVVLIDYHI
jgi:hypothetical protein